MSRTRHLPRARRLFTRRRSRLTTTLLAVAAIVVTACQPEEAPPRPNYSDIKVEWVSMGHTVAFADGSPSLAADAKEPLARNAVNGGDLDVGLIPEKLRHELAVPVRCSLDQQHAQFAFEDDGAERSGVVVFAAFARPRLSSERVFVIAGFS